MDPDPPKNPCKDLSSPLLPSPFITSAWEGALKVWTRFRMDSRGVNSQMTNAEGKKKLRLLGSQQTAPTREREEETLVHAA